MAERTRMSVQAKMGAEQALFSDDFAEDPVDQGARFLEKGVAVRVIYHDGGGGAADFTDVNGIVTMYPVDELIEFSPLDEADAQLSWPIAELKAVEMLGQCITIVGSDSGSMQL